MLNFKRLMSTLFIAVTFVWYSKAYRIFDDEIIWRQNTPFEEAISRLEQLAVDALHRDNGEFATLHLLTQITFSRPNSNLNPCEQRWRRPFQQTFPVASSRICISLVDSVSRFSPLLNAEHTEYADKLKLRLLHFILRQVEDELKPLSPVLSGTLGIHGSWNASVPTARRTFAPCARLMLRHQGSNVILDSTGGMLAQA